MKKDKNLLDDNITKILNDPERIAKVIQSGMQYALWKNKQAGNQVCEWCDNKVVGFHLSMNRYQINGTKDESLGRQFRGYS